MHKSDPRVYDIQNYDKSSLEIIRSHKCQGTEINDYVKENKPEMPLGEMQKVKCILVKIVLGRSILFFHFEIDGKINFYKFEGITADLKIVLYCTKIPRSKCSNVANI